jgi:fatty-acyl-CoA synthase
VRTLISRIEAATSGPGSITFVTGDTEVRLSWAELHDDARAMAAALQARGIVPGDHVALLAPTSRLLVTAIQATWIAGATLVVLPLPMRLASIEEFVSQTRLRINRADSKLLVIDPELAAFYAPAPGDPPTVSLVELADAARQLGSGRYERPLEDPDSLAILQFTSGSTSEPKGVMLPHRTVCANLDAIYEATGYDIHTDCLVSWLPLYHDMGLVGMLCTPMMNGSGSVIGAPQDFLGSPGRWMEWISDHKGTATAGPNFSWVLATRALRRSKRQLDLSSLRVAINGAEPVDPETVEAFIAAAAPHGFKAGGVFPAFGMAEVAIAGAFPPPWRGLATDCVDRTVLEAERYAAPAGPDAPHARRFAKLGKPVPGLEMRIVDPADGHVLQEREVGELEIRGTSVTPGYYKAEEANAALFHDGWLRTGDLAYLVDGELVMCGRIKDVIIIGGRNVFPEDIEKAVAAIEGVRAGNVMAFGVEGRKGKEQIVVAAEVRADDLAAVRSQVHHRVQDVAGAPPHDIVLVSPGTLPKTSSGKLQRTLCRQRYQAGSLEMAKTSS